jgi:hypothetical protein
VGTGIGEDIGLVVGLAQGVLGFATERRHNRERADQQLNVANKHLEQIAGLPPDEEHGPGSKRNDWARHVAKALRNAQAYVDDLVGKTQEEYQQKIDDAWQRLRDLHQPARQ